ncbi:MAG TPA: copper resistance protein CopC, partial [Dehalococcoidia bacterium]|nr:copper resistance protein CopC [Dehalococcoidia bacterium]
WMTLGLFLAAVLVLPPFALPAAAQPRIRLSDPADGALVARLPKQGRICFSQPIALGFNLTLTAPDGRLIPVATSFPPDGLCLGIVIEPPSGATAGDWTFRWQATSRQTNEKGSGTIRFTVKASAETAPEAGNPSAGGQGPDIGSRAAVTTAAILGAAALGFVLYLVRRRLGFWLHRPPPRTGGEGHH